MYIIKDSGTCQDRNMKNAKNKRAKAINDHPASILIKSFIESSLL